MEKKGLSQEGLKIIACITMLIDHIGASLIPVIGLRIVGRIAFPIYCFLLAEGVYHTRSPRHYGARLAIGMILSEVPFELLFFGSLTGRHTSVMVTLLLGFLYGVAQKNMTKVFLKVLLLVPFAFAAELLNTDYGAWGVAMIAVFLLIREGKYRGLIHTIWLATVCWAMNSARIPLAGVRIPIEMFAVLSMIPIACYSGRKVTSSAWVQWGFYLFYPVHLTALLLIAAFC